MMPSDALARNEANASEVDGTEKKGGLRFIKDAAAAKNLCDFPELKDQHGNLISPDTTLLAQELLPLFSRDKLSTFQDILVPTPSYTWQNKAVKREDWVPWEKKKCFDGTIGWLHIYRPVYGPSIKDQVITGANSKSWVG